MSDEKEIGTCSMCGGAVKVFTGPWYGINPPVPRCTKCNAKPSPPKNVIPMQR